MCNYLFLHKNNLFFGPPAAPFAARRATLLRALMLLILGSAGLACTDPNALPSAVPDGPVKWSYIAVGVDGAQLRARGFDQALPQATTLSIWQGDQRCAETQADARGRFDLRFDPCDPAQQPNIDDAPMVVNLRVADAQGQIAALDFAVRDVEQALDAAVQGRLTQTGALANDLAFAPSLCSAQQAPLWLLSSGDNLVDNFDLPSAQRLFPVLRFSDSESRADEGAAQPFAMAPSQGLMAVSRFAQSGVSVFDLASGQLLAQAAADLSVALPTPFVPAIPVDSDGDGVTESVIRSLRPRHFQAIAFNGQRLFVSAVNMLRSADPAVYGPGMVLVYDWDGVDLKPAMPAILWTRWANPQGLLLNDQDLYVISTGVIELLQGQWQASSPGGVERFSATSLESLAWADLGSSAPAAASLSDDARSLYLGSLLRAEIYHLDAVDLQLRRGPQDPIRLLASDDTQSIFGLQAHPSGLLFASSFDSDVLFVVDSNNDAVSPWPFARPLALNAHSSALAGSHKIALRPGRNGVDFRGPDVLILQSLAARVVGVDTRRILGP